ncbi:MAG: enhanced serine sensitivity protein SseB C-terminal domain-containing protein [Firmicutes bacterium]|nr:enhanced serine sensitivity protein SseB C-terminal domain-containing protein [Bacillota bacterium]
MAENEKLVQAMQAMKSDPQKNSVAFANELFYVKLITPVSINPEPKNGQVAPGSVISYITLHDKEKDKNFILTFTDRDEYLKYFKAGSTQIMRHTYRELASITMSHNRFDGFIIDPMGENVAVTRELMTKLATAIGADKNVQLEQEKLDLSLENSYNAAEEVSEELKSALDEYFKQNDAINAAWLFYSKRQNEEKPVLVCAVDFEGNMAQIFSGIVNALGKKIAVGESFGLISAKDNVAAEAIKNISPIYTKK